MPQLNEGNPIAEVMDRLSQGLPAEEPAAVEPPVVVAPVVPDKIEALEGTVRNLAGQIEKIAETTAKLATTLPAQPSPEIVAAVEDDVVLEPELEKAVTKLVEKKLKVAEAAREQKTQAETLQQKWDRKADTEVYPWLFNPEHPRYKPEYAAELKTEYDGMLNKGAPDAVYNACARVASRIADREVAITTQNVIRDANVRGSHIESARPAPVGTEGRTDLTNEQRYMARRLGVSEDKYREMHGQVRRNIH